MVGQVRERVTYHSMRLPRARTPIRENRDIQPTHQRFDHRRDLRLEHLLLARALVIHPAEPEREALAVVLRVRDLDHRWPSSITLSFRRMMLTVIIGFVVVLVRMMCRDYGFFARLSLRFGLRPDAGDYADGHRLFRSFVRSNDWLGGRKWIRRVVTSLLPLQSLVSCRRWCSCLFGYSPILWLIPGTKRVSVVTIGNARMNRSDMDKGQSAIVYGES